ncbi:MAG: LysM peptidoglycan-binding domain-containing protein [Proteobacteria bacterium]|nr:LysM peptidoglycan-binding domain-containing protein [Pseudomonadota bacterium]
MLKKLPLLLILIAVLIMASSVQAEIELNPSHPDTYTVVKGDTLWDISARFLKSPWVWPEVWHANPQIDNPHLIYPGDTVSLVYLDGKPRLQVNRGHPTIKLTPQGRIIDRGDAIPTIPLSDILPFLKKLRILDEEEINTAPYIVSMEEGRLRGTDPNLIYVRNLVAKQGDTFAVVRPTVIYRDVPVDYPWESSPYKDRKTESLAWQKTSTSTGSAIMTRFWKAYIDRTYWDNVKILGYEVADIATAVVTRVGTEDIITMKVNSNIMEAKVGDLVIPLNEDSFNAFFQPKGATIVDDNIRIVALNNALFRSGKWQIVAISRGTRDGVGVGDVFDVYRPEHKIRDEVMHPKEDLKTLFRPSKAMVTLPEEFLANIMVFQAFSHISYAIIVEGNRPVMLFDVVRAP